MMAANPKTTCTVEEYLAFERRSETKHEYFAGEIVAMAGASYVHNLIVGSTGAALHQQLRRRACSVVMSLQRILAAPNSAVMYPDITVVCGEPQFADERPDTVMNPTVIVEVLSPSTEGDDRDRKFRPYVRAEGGWWQLTEATGLGATIHLHSIGCTLALADVYERVTLAATEESRQ
jgi:Uma2 family endonuclease